MLQTIIDAWIAARLKEKAKAIAPDQTRIVEMGWESYLNNPGEVPHMPRHIRNAELAS